MKKALPYIIVACIVFACVVLGFFVHNSVETKKQVEQATQRQAEAQQNIDDFLSMLPADFLVRDDQDGGYIGNLYIRISESETEAGKLNIEMKPVGSDYSKDITYSGGGEAELFLEGMNATCVWTPDFVVSEGAKNVLTEDGKRYNKSTFYLDAVDLDNQQVTINNTSNDYVLQKQNN